MDEWRGGDDGLRGPVGDRFGAALEGAGAAGGFAVRYPTVQETWVDQPRKGRHLTVRWSSIGSKGTTTGTRWIALRLTTLDLLGPWADGPVTADAQLLGRTLLLTPEPPSPTGIWREDPELGAAWWAYAQRVAPEPLATHDDTAPWVQVVVRNEALVLHLRASVLDADLLGEGLGLLERTAVWAERNDEAIDARLGRDPSVARNRRITTVALIAGVAAAAVIALILLGAVVRFTFSW